MLKPAFWASSFARQTGVTDLSPTAGHRKDEQKNELVFCVPNKCRFFVELCPD